MNLPKTINERVTVILSVILLLTLIMPWYSADIYSAGSRSMAGGSIGLGYDYTIDFYFIDLLKNAKWWFKIIYITLPICAALLLWGAWKENGVFFLERKYITSCILITLVAYVIDNQVLANLEGVTMKFKIFSLGSSFAVVAGLLLHFNGFANKLYIKYIKK